MVIRNSIVVFIFTFIYSFIRYNVYGTVPIADIPTLIVNKSVSFSLTIFLLFACISRIKAKYTEYKSYMQLTKTFVIIHVLLSLSILSENYFPKLYDNAKLTFSGGFALLFGVLALLSYLYKGSIKNILIFCLLVLFHLVFIGFKGWINNEKWNGMMPPITLICSFLLVIIMIIVGFVMNKKMFTND